MSSSAPLEALTAYLELLRQMGWTGFDCAPETLTRMRSWPSSLEILLDRVMDCRRCRPADGRRSVVFGTGSRGARFLFVGDFPRSPISPLAGPDGRLLRKIIIEALHLAESDFYVCNLVKCHLPEPLDPACAAAHCGLWLDAQIALVRPAVIIALGPAAARYLVGQDDITALRRRFFTRGISRVAVTDHPAQLLIEPERKRDVWEDLKWLMKAYPSSGAP